MKVIGLTGPTGAGKSAVSDLMNLPVVNADQVARGVHKNPVVLQELCDRFGDDICSGGVLNRTVLAHRAFATPEATADLNAIMHPRILEEIQRELARLAQEGTAMCILDAPLLFEGGCDTLCHTVLCVLAGRDVRKNRIVERDGISGEMAEQRMCAQPDDEFYKSRCDYVLYNNGKIEELQQAVKQLLAKL